MSLLIFIMDKDEVFDEELDETVDEFDLDEELED